MHDSYYDSKEFHSGRESENPQNLKTNSRFGSGVVLDCINSWSLPSSLLNTSREYFHFQLHVNKL